MSQDKLLSSLSNFNLKYVYIVDDKTNNNVFTLMKKKESDTSDYSVSIPIKYRKYISKLLNLTNSKKDYTSKRILKIKPLGVVFSHRLDNSNTMNIEDGISFITNKENNDDPYNKKKSYFDELTFGEDRGKEGLKKNQKTFKLSFNAEIAAKQLRDNIFLIREDINIDAETKIWVIARCDDALETKLYFTQLDADKEIQPQSLPPKSVELLNDSTAPPTLSPSQASSLVSIPSTPQAVSTVLTKEDIQRRKPLPQQPVKLLNDSTVSTLSEEQKKRPQLPPSGNASQASSLVTISSAQPQQSVELLNDSTVSARLSQSQSPPTPPPMPSAEEYNKASLKDKQASNSNVSITTPIPSPSQSPSTGNAPPPPPMPSDEEYNKGSLKGKQASNSNVSAPKLPPPISSAPPAQKSTSQIDKKYERNAEEIKNINQNLQEFIETENRDYNILQKKLYLEEPINDLAELIRILKEIIRVNSNKDAMILHQLKIKLKILEKEEKSPAVPTVLQDIKKEEATPVAQKQKALDSHKLRALGYYLAHNDIDYENDTLSNTLFSDNPIKNDKELLNYLLKIKELNCTDNLDKTNCSLITRKIDDLKEYDDDKRKKYYNKYSKYKQKYLEAKKLEKEEKSSTEAPVSQGIKEEESKTQKPLKDEQLRALARLLITRPILEEDWDEYPTSNAEGSDFLSKDLGSVKRITSEADLIEYLQEIIKLNCNSASKNNSCDQIKAFIETLGAFEGGKKYYNKYSKYKQKYLEAKKLHGDELHGDELHGDKLHGDKLHGNELHGKEIQYGGGKCTIILCPQPVWEVLNDLYKERKFNDIEFFIFIMGPRSFLTDEKTRKLCSCWDVCIDNYWDGGLGLVPGKLYNTFDIAIAKKQINAKMSNGVIKINHIDYYGYKYFYFNSSLFSGYEITF